MQYKTARDLITIAYRRAGIIAYAEIPDANETQMALHTLNGLINSLRQEALYPNSVNSYDFVTTTSNNYTIGIPIVGFPDPDIVVGQEIVEIREAMVNVGNVWTRMNVISVDQIASIDHLATGAIIPQSLALNRTRDPYDRITFLNPPVGGYAVRLWVNGSCPNYDLDTEINIPAGYFETLEYGLAMRLLVDMGRDATNMASIFNSNIARIKSVNLKTKQVPMQGFGGQYNIGTSSMVYPSRY